MFHPKSIVNGGVLKKVWKAANKITNSDDECDLPETCRNLDTWINSNDFQVNKRLSLRTSATLINGAARVYQSGVCKLLEDIKDMDKKITRRKRERTNSSSDNYVSSECAATPEQIRRQTRRSFETSFSTMKRTKIYSDSSNNSTSNDAISRSSNQSTSDCANMENRSHSSSRTSESFSNNSGSNKKPSPASKRSSHNEVSETSTEKERRDQGVQTSPRRERDNSTLEEDGLDKDLPFGYIIIHDNYYSRIPSKIILTSINSNVRNLI